MSRKKLTLSVEERLTRRAKAIAEERGTSVSRLVEMFFTILEQEEGGTEVGRTQETGEGPSPGSTATSPHADYEPSDWTRQWSGAFDTEDGETTYPEDPSWEEKVLAEEIEKKHAS